MQLHPQVGAGDAHRPLVLVRPAGEERGHAAALGPRLAPVERGRAGDERGQQRQVDAGPGRAGRMRGSSHRLSRCRRAGRRAHNPPMADASDSADPPIGQPAPQALAGVRVLDLSRVLAGPWCTQILADLGADVIKVERPPGDGHPGGDDTRGWGPPFLKDARRPRNRRGRLLPRHQPQQALDHDRPRHARGRRRWCARWRRSCDVLVENFKVGDMARHGLDAASLLALNPRLVYCSITGFGQTGPYRDRAGYDYAIQGMGGLMSVTGPSRAEIADDAPGGGPQKVGVAVADLFTGMYAVDRDPGGAAPPRRHRPGPGDRHGAARHPGGDARQPRRQLPRHRRGAAARRQRAPEHRPVPGVRGRRRAHDPRRRQRRPVRPLLRRRRLRRARARSALRPQRRPGAPPRDAGAAARRDAEARARAATGSRRSKRPRCPCGPINDLADVFADPQVQARAA